MPYFIYNSLLPTIMYPRCSSLEFCGRFSFIGSYPAFVFRNSTILSVFFMSSLFITQLFLSFFITSLKVILSFLFYYLSYFISFLSLSCLSSIHPPPLIYLSFIPIQFPLVVPCNTIRMLLSILQNQSPQIYLLNYFATTFTKTTLYGHKTLISF